MKMFTNSKNLVITIASLLVFSSVFGVNGINRLFVILNPKVEEQAPNLADCPGLTYTCRDQVNFSLDLACSGVIKADMLFINALNLPDDTFNIVVTTLAGVAHANSFSAVDLGKTFKVSVSVKGCDNAPCWSNVRIEDKYKPSLVCTNDTITCAEPIDSALVATATDNCGNVSVNLVSSTYKPINCDSDASKDFFGYFERVWRAVDTYGRDTSCTQLVYVKRTNLDSIKVPAAISVSCGSFTTPFPNASQTGYLTIEGKPLKPDSQELCLANLTMKDTVISSLANCNKTVRRTWSLIQWTCSQPIIKNFNQIITIIDTTAPVLTPMADIIVEANNNCKWTGRLPKIVYNDNCNNDRVTVKVDYVGGSASSNEPMVTLSSGSSSIYYTVTDGSCGNSSVMKISITVVDKTAPVALCKKPIVALTSAGEGFITVKDVNNGSFDACGTLRSIKIRRMESTCQADTAWQDTLNYCCTDIGKTDLMVALRIEDNVGNVNVCMTPIEVQYKHIPTPVFPADTTVKCSFLFDINNLGASFGQPGISGVACATGGSFPESVFTELDACQSGRIYRRFRFEFNGQVIARDTQIITIVPDTIIDASNALTFINWPLQNVTAQFGQTSPTFTGTATAKRFVACNMIGFSSKDDTIGSPANGTCFKIFRTFRAMNMCGPNANNVFSEFTQTIEVVDTVKPDITTATTIRSVCSFSNSCSTKETVLLDAVAIDNGPLSDLGWTFQIDLFKNGTIDTSGTSRSISYQAPVGLHSITFRVFDACGSLDEITYDFEVKNCKEPTAKCIGLVTKTMADPDGNGPLQPMVAIKAKEFDAQSEDICTPYDSLRFTFNMIYPVESLIYQNHYFKQVNGVSVVATLAEYNLGLAQLWIAAERTSIMVFNCTNSRNFMVTIWDLDKNKGVCNPRLVLDGCCTDFVNPIISTVVPAPITIQNNSTNCNAITNVTITAAATDNVTPTNLLTWIYRVNVLNDSNTSNDLSGTTNSAVVGLPIGTHSVRFIVQDTCLNTDTLDYRIIILNDKRPAAICRTTPISVTLVDADGTGPMLPMDTLAARELDNLSTPSFDSCTTDQLIYTFGGAFGTSYPVTSSIGVVHFFSGNGQTATQAQWEAGTAQRWNPTTRSSEIKLNCNLNNTSQTYVMTVWDSQLNSSTCAVTVNISGNCPCNDLSAPVITTLDTTRNFTTTAASCTDSINVTLAATATDNGPLSRLSWIYRVDLGNNGTIETNGNVSLTNTASVVVRAPNGTHRITFIVNDTCSNRDTISYLFNIRNVAPPRCTARAVTLNTIFAIGTTANPPAAMAELRADTLNNGSADACTPANQLIYTFDGAYPVRSSINTIHLFKGNGLTATQAEFDAGTAQRWNPTLRTSYRKMTCSTQNSPTITMTVWDADTLSSSCTAVVTLVCPAQIGNFVWEDLNANGQQDAGEPGIAGVIVRLLNSAGNLIQTTTTDAQGLYCFTGLTPGSYIIQFDTPTGRTPSPANTGADATDSDASIVDGRTQTYNLGSNEVNKTVDAGFVPTGQIGSFVWEDRNGNGQQDPGEPGIPNVIVRLLNSAGTVIRTTTTDSIGLYCFTNLPAGTYIVEFVTPAGRIPTSSNTGIDSLDSDAAVSNGRTQPYVLGLGQINKTVDAGYVPVGQIGNFVWEDRNGNGRQDAGEPGIPNATVRLLNNAGTVIQTTTTDAQGLYCFTNLPAGTYTIEFVTPGDRTPSPQNVNPDSTDSDAAVSNGRTQPYILAIGEINKTVDAGFVPRAFNCIPNAYTGMMVATCNSFASFNSPLDPNEPVAVIFDVRPNATANTNLNWIRGGFYGPNWGIDDLGQIFGIAIDDSANIYFAQSDVYQSNNNQSPATLGRIYKSRPPLFRAEVFATLPNAGGEFNGLGNIAYDRKHNQLFATNLEDGKIYRINNLGQIVQTYDPFTADNGVAGIAPQAEQIWGIGVNYEGSATKLYFPRINGTNRQIYSLALTSTGALPSLVNQEIVAINNVPGDEVRITDIEFDESGTRMLFAERGGTTRYNRLDFITQGPYTGISGEYKLSGSNWGLSRVFNVGGNIQQELTTAGNTYTGISSGQNSAGGVTYGFRQVGTDTFSNKDSAVWLSGNWLHKGTSFTPGSDDTLYYGAQAVFGGTTLGNVKTDIVIDFDNNGRTLENKRSIGDVDIFPCRFIPTTSAILAKISGEVISSEEEYVEDVEVVLEGDIKLVNRTQTDGKYSFENVEGTKSYQVYPVKNNDLLNGIDVLDLLQIQRHILGIRKLDNPFKLIAADVNANKTINIADMVELRKAILGITEQFENNNSWKFIDANHIFASATNPWSSPIPESYSITNLSENMTVRFKGVKIGDIDGSAIANSKRVKARSNAKVTLTLGNETIENLVPVYADQVDLDAMLLSWDNSADQIIEIVSGQLQVDNRDIYKTDLALTMLFTNPDAKSIDLSKPIFFLRIKDEAFSEIKLLDNSGWYTEEEGRTSVNLSVRGKMIQNQNISLEQNIPNPWNTMTIINFEATKASAIRFTVSDMTGRVVLLRNIDAQKGVNQISIQRAQLGISGIYHYSIVSEDQIITKHMLLVD